MPNCAVSVVKIKGKDIIIKESPHILLKFTNKVFLEGVFRNLLLYFANDVTIEEK